MTMLRMRRRTHKAFPNMRIVTIGLAGLAVTVSLCLQARASAQQAAPRDGGRPINTFDRCGATRVEPPSGRSIAIASRATTKSFNPAGLLLDEADVANPGGSPEVWEKVVRKLRGRARCLLPAMPQPPMEDRRALLSWLVHCSIRPPPRSRTRAARWVDVTASQWYRVSKRHQRSAVPLFSLHGAPARR